MNVEIVRAPDRVPEGSIFIIPIRLEEYILPRRLAPYHRADYFAPTGYQGIFDAQSARAYYLNRVMPTREPESTR